MPDAPPLPDSPPPAQFVPLYCPDCGYNLSGTTEDRCSECGRPFDRTALTQWNFSHGQPLPFGALNPTSEPSSIVTAGLFTPARLGRLLPPFADATEASQYALRMRLWAGLGIPLFFALILVTCVGQAEVFLVGFLFAIPVLVASLACEAVIADMLGRWVPARSVPPEQQRQFWRTLLRCFSTHILASSVLFFLALGLMLIGLNMNRSAQGRMWDILWMSLPHLAVAASILWWWYGLGSAIAARGTPCAARTIVILLIPLAAALALALGIGIGMVEGAVTATICR